MSKPGTCDLEREAKKEIASTYNTLSGFLAGLSFTVMFFYIGQPLNLDITSGNLEAGLNFVTILLLVAQCMLFLFAAVLYSDSIKVAIGAKLGVEVKFEDLLAKADNLTFVGFLLLMASMGVVTLRLNTVLGILAIIIMVASFFLFVKMDKVQFHSKRKKEKKVPSAA